MALKIFSSCSGVRALAVLWLFHSAGAKSRRYATSGWPSNRKSPPPPSTHFSESHGMTVNANRGTLVNFYPAVDAVD